MTIVDDNFAHMSKFPLFFDNLVYMMIAWIPGSFIVRKHMNTMCLCQLLYFTSMIQTYRQGFFNHHVYSPGSTGPDYIQMAMNGTKGCYSLRIYRVEHFVQVMIDQILCKPVAIQIFSDQDRIFLSNADNGNVFLMGFIVYPVDMVMAQPRYTQPYWLIHLYTREMHQ